LKSRGAYGIAVLTSKFYLLFFLIAAVGVYFRLDQFLLQVLLDDEWHVIHQLLLKDPQALFNTFGHADFSIPLALLYWLELNLFGLSEIGMRWPMMLAGLITLVVFPLYVRKFLDDKTTLFFSVLLAISPLLVLYSRTARPYALTLVLSMLALAAFYRFVEAERPAWKLGFVYAVCATLSIWLHLISLPVVVAPFLVLGIPALFDRNRARVGRIFWLGVVTLAGMLVLVLPPLLAHPEALAVKLGTSRPDLQTYYGLPYFWLGTSSLAVVLFGVLLAFLGAGKLWRDVPLSRSLLVGLGLTYGVILLTQPAWVHNPLTFSRYLLPALPLFLLSVAAGVTRLGDTCTLRFAKPGKYVYSILVVAVLLPMAFYSPLPKILATPNSNSLHSVYVFDFREEKNLIYQYQKDFPVSSFWSRLGTFPKNSLKIAASPFSFETNHWDAARWEQISHQRVVPGYLDGLCAENRWGEVPRGKGFEFRNAGYLADQDDLSRRGFDLVVYQKPFKVLTYQGEREYGMDTAACEAVLRERFPNPVFEDELLVVFPLSDRLARQFNTTR